jgi:hypothetical protein
MINHFRTYLLNRSASFFTGSLFPVYTDTDFIAADHTLFTRRVNNSLFGERPDATLLDYRFFQFLRLIRSCGLLEHVRRFDSRETYTLEEYDFTDPAFFSPVITPMSGLRVQEFGTGYTDAMRILLEITRIEPSGQIMVIHNSEALLTVSEPDPQQGSQFTIPSLGLRITVNRSGKWMLDYRRKGIRELPNIINTALSLPAADVYTPLFESIREDAPEYEKGFRNITDKLHRFCMLLFAQAIAIEKLTTVS